MQFTDSRVAALVYPHCQRGALFGSTASLKAAKMLQLALSRV